MFRRPLSAVGLALAMMTALSACGGGGGVDSVGSMPTPTPTPTPSNLTITDLRASQTFTNDASQTDVAFNTASRTAISANAGTTTLSVRYDAATGGYTISGAGTSETFTRSDQVATNVQGETRYQRLAANQNTYLTLVTTPYGGMTPNRYVGMGYLQRNTGSAERQDTTFSTFTYGFNTPADGVPRAGSGTFNTDVFGLSSIPGTEPEVFQGQGRFDVDFVNGQFSTSTPLTRYGLVSGSGISGGGIYLTGGGLLSVSNGILTGNVVYGSSAGQIGGILNGRFYGPNAQEIGATFAGSSADGSAFNGALTGQRAPNLEAVNISFARLVTSQILFADATTLSVSTPIDGSTPTVRDYPGDLGRSVSSASLNINTNGSLVFGPPSSDLPGGEYAASSIIAGDPNFVTYRKTVDNQVTTLELYRTGGDNRELALTYASFGRYSTTDNENIYISTSHRLFFVYGFETPGGLLANRTGTASYSGIAYGAGADVNGSFYDVTGTTRLSVDFGRQSLSGELALAGRNGATMIGYGAFGFAGSLSRINSSSAAEISRSGGESIGTMLVNFYGPAANEAAGIFRLRVPDGVGANTIINGALVARQQ